MALHTFAKSDLILDHLSAGPVRDVILKTAMANDWTGNMLEKIVGETLAYGAPVFLVKWIGSGSRLYQPVIAWDLFKLSPNQVLAYFRKIHRNDVPWRAILGSDKEKDLKRMADFKTSNPHLHINATNAQHSISDYTYDVLENFQEAPTMPQPDAEQRYPTGYKDDSCSSIDLDILELDCKDSIAYSEIMTWPSFMN